jgi:hypothetical protein
LKFVRWPSRASVGSDNGDKSIPENIKIAHAEDWELACPGLSTVLFIDGSTLQRRFGKYEWVDSDFF